VQVGEKKAGISDLYRVNESALSGLDDEAFLKLRKTGCFAPGLCADHVHATDRPLRSADAAAAAARAQQPKIRPPEELFKMEPTDLIRFD
jgi:hypothetical protein